MLNLNPDTVNAEIKAQQGRGGAGGGRTGSAGGEVALEQQDPQQGSRGPRVQVTPEECAPIMAAIEKKPAEKKKLDDLSAKMRTPDADRRAIMGEQQAIYKTIGVDAQKAGACRRLASGGANGGRGGNNGGGTGAATTPNSQRGATPGAAGNAPRANGQTGALTPAGDMGGQARRPRSGLVFVATDTTNKNFAPRVLQLGQGNFDYTEVMSGLKEGDRVVLISALQMQAARQAQNDRTRQSMGVPGLNPNAGPGGAGAGGRGPGGAPGGGGGGGGGGAARGGRGG
jgi:HlyD family secretion protein